MLRQFSENLMKYRKRCAMTQSQLAAKLNVTPQAVSKWENGSLPDSEFLPRLADVLGVSIDALFGVKHAQEIPDLEQLIFDKLHQTPAENRADVVMQLVHSMMCAYQDYRLSNTKHPENLELVTYDELKTEYEIGLARLNEDMKFFCYAKIPEQGVNSYTEPTDDMIRLFKLLSDKDAIHIIHYLASGIRNRMQSLEVISNKLNIPQERVQKIMDQLDRFGLVWRVSAELPDSSPIIYGYTNNPLIIYELIFAKALTNYIRFHDVYVDNFTHGACRMKNVANSDPIPQVTAWDKDADQ